MNNYHKELLMELIGKWSNEQLQGYIYDLEIRLNDERDLLKELKQIQKKRNKKKLALNNRFQGE